MDDNYGNIYINFATPFSLQGYIKDIGHKIENVNENNVISTLAHEIIYRYYALSIILTLYILYNFKCVMIKYIFVDNSIVWFYHTLIY